MSNDNIVRAVHVRNSTVYYWVDSFPVSRFDAPRLVLIGYDF